MLLGGCNIYWRTSPQGSLAQSVDEAEVMAANEGARQLMHFKNLATELGVLDGAVPELRVDNAGVLRISERGFGERTKHLNLQPLYLHGLKDQGLVSVSTVKSQKNAADVLTKSATIKQMIEAFATTRTGNFVREKEAGADT